MRRVLGGIGAAVFALSLVLVACDDGAAPEGSPGEAIGEISEWHAGNFRYLASKIPVANAQRNLEAFVTDTSELEHPSSGYTQVSLDRERKFEAFLDAMFTAIDDSKSETGDGDWCQVKRLANAAAYEIFRLYDEENGRWLIYGRDRTEYGGQSYFFVNPMGKRNLVVEVPHEGYELYTGAEGARAFLDLAAKVLLVNRDHRCASHLGSQCGGSTSVCGGAYTRADVAHNESNTFHLFHAFYEARHSDAKFVQLHGMNDDPRLVDAADVSTGTNSSSVSMRFANALRGRLTTGASEVRSCQDPTLTSTMRQAMLCATTNVQGKETNRAGAHDGNICDDSVSTTNSTGRFLHVEQDSTMRQDPNRGLVIQSVGDAWAPWSCESWTSGCGLGPRQRLSTLPDLACSPIPAPTGGVTAKITYYWAAQQPESDTSTAAQIKDCSGNVLGTSSTTFFDELAMEGTGFLNSRNGYKKVNLSNPSVPCFFVLQDSYPWGAGSWDASEGRSYELHPFRSVAADGNFTHGKWYYIPQFDGKSIGTLDPMIHDGCVRVVDVGPGVSGAHIDFFAGTKAAQQHLEGIVASLSNVTVIDPGTSGKCAHHQ